LLWPPPAALTEQRLASALRALGGHLPIEVKVDDLDGVYEHLGRRLLHLPKR
jgi:hypothetical protein